MQQSVPHIIHFYIIENTHTSKSSTVVTSLLSLLVFLTVLSTSSFSHILPFLCPYINNGNAIEEVFANDGDNGNAIEKK